MRAYSRSLLALVALLIAGTAWAQEQKPGGWLGVQTQDVSKQEANKLGWEAPRGAKVVDLTTGAPAAAAGLQLDDVIATLDGVEVENANALTAALSARGSGTTVKLRLVRAGKERTVTVTLGARPAGLVAKSENAPQVMLMLDTGGHTANVRGVAITPDGKQIVSASEDKDHQSLGHRDWPDRAHDPW